MIYTSAVFKATGSEYSQVCPRVSSAVKPFYWFNFIKVCRPSSMQSFLNIKQTAPVVKRAMSQQSLLLEISESKTKIYFAAQMLAN